MQWLFRFAVFAGLVLLAGRVYLQPGMPYTHDGENHLARFANYRIAIKEGQIPPRFAPNLWNHYGYPVFNYNYPLANIMSVPLTVVGLSYQQVFKVLALAALGLGVLGFYVWLGKLQVSGWSRLAGLTFVASSPFVLNLTYVRGNIGELFALALLPWLLVFIEKVRQQDPTQRQWTLLWGSLFGAAFALAHNVSVLLAIPMLGIYAAFRWQKDASAWRDGVVVSVFSFLLSAWFWLPALFERSEIILNSADLSLGFAEHFATIDQLLFAPVRFGFSVPGSIDTLSFSVGLAGVVAVGLLLIQAVSLHRQARLWPSWVWALLLIWLLGFVLQLAVSNVVWTVVAMASFIQFPWRWTLIMLPAAAGVIGWVMKHGQRWQRVAVIALLLLQVAAALRMRAVDYFNRTDVDYEAFSQSTSTMNENLPVTWTLIEFSQWQPAPTLLPAESGSVEIDYWKGSDRQYRVKTTEPTLVIEPTMHFLGWQTWVNDELIQHVDSRDIAGRIAYTLDEPGEYSVRTRFTQHTMPRLIGNTFSLLTAGVLAGYAVQLGLRRKQRAG